MNKMKQIAGIAAVLMAGMVQADVLFTGAGADQNFSTAGNWDTAPVTSDNIYIAANGTSASTPAVIDSGFNVDLNLAKIYSTGAGTTGTAYAEVASGGTLKATAVFVGNAANQWYDGDLIVRSGGTIVARYANSGAFDIGGGDAGEVGNVTVESGASFSHAMLNLQAYGTLTLEAGASSVSAFSASRFTVGGANTLDGLLQVDLDILTATGSYILIDGSSFAPIAGSLLTDMTAAGGSITDVSESSSFNVLNEGDAEWSLTTANGGQDLVLNVTAIPEPATLGLVAAFGGTIIWIRRTFMI
jgi:hypothetical protein